MKKIIIVGGGYGGIKALETFALYDEDLEVTLIDQHTYHYLQTESYDLVASKIPIEETFIYLPSLVASFEKNFKFICDEALDIKENTLICKNREYEFDYLIIATGSVTKFLKGFEEKGKNSLGVKSLRAALKVKQYFEKELFDRLEPQIAKNSFNIVVIGGGLSGVEIASEMRYFFNRYSKNNALTCGNIHIKLLSKHILKGQNESTRKKSIQRLAELGVEIVKNYVKEIDEKRVVLDNDQHIDFDFAIFTGGIEPSPFIKNISFKKDEKGFLIVDEYLRIKENIFAIGDAAKLIDHFGKTVPPTAQSAEQSGVNAAKNIIYHIKGEPLEKVDIKLRGLAIALGGKYAIVSTPFGFNIHGFLGWLIKKGIEKYYKIPLKIKALKGYKILKLCQKAE